VVEVKQSTLIPEFSEYGEEEIDESLIEAMLELVQKLPSQSIPISTIELLLRDRTTEDYALAQAIELEREYQFGDVDVLLQAIGNAHPRQINALRRLLRLEATAVEMELTRELRDLWIDHAEFHVFLNRTYRIISTIAAYSSLPWELGLSLIRQCDGIPEIEDLELILTTLFNYWRDNEELLKVFPAFQIWLQSLLKEPLPHGLEMWSQSLEGGWQ
jgi:hypothetical protein